MNRAENVLDRGGTRQVDVGQAAVRELHLQIVGAQIDPGAMIQHRKRGARCQGVEAAGIQHVRAGTADEPRELDARQRIDLGADRQLAVRQRETRVTRLVQRVAAQAAVDDVRAGPAGDHVVTRAADQYVGQRVADDGVGERRAGHVGEAREFVEVGRQPAREVHDDCFACRAEVQRIDPRAALEYLDRREGQAVRRTAVHLEVTTGLQDHRDVRRDGREIDRVDALAVVAARGFGERIHAPVVGEDVGVVADSAGHRVGAQTTSNDVVELVAGDLVIARAGLHVLEDVDRREREREVPADGLSVYFRQTDLDIRGAGREVQRVGAARGFIEEEAALGLAGVEDIRVVAGAADQDHGSQRGKLEVEGVCACAAGKGRVLDLDKCVAAQPEGQLRGTHEGEIDIARLDDGVGPAAAGQRVRAGAAGQDVGIAIAGDRVVERRADDVLEALDLGESGGCAEGGVSREVDDDGARVGRVVERVAAVADGQVLDPVEDADAGCRPCVHAADRPRGSAADVVAGCVVGAEEGVDAGAAVDRQRFAQNVGGETVLAITTIDHQTQDADRGIAQGECLQNRRRGIVVVREVDDDAAVGRRRYLVNADRVVGAREGNRVSARSGTRRDHRVRRQKQARFHRLEQQLLLKRRSARTRFRGGAERRMTVRTQEPRQLKPRHTRPPRIGAVGVIFEACLATASHTTFALQRTGATQCRCSNLAAQVPRAFCVQPLLL